MTTSGSKTFELDVSEYIEEAFERCGLEPRTGYDLRTARRSLNLLLADWANRGLNQWTITNATTAVSVNTPDYTLGADTIDVLSPVVLRTGTAWRPGRSHPPCCARARAQIRVTLNLRASAEVIMSISRIKTRLVGLYSILWTGRSAPLSGCGLFLTQATRWFMTGLCAWMMPLPTAIPCRCRSGSTRGTGLLSRAETCARQGAVVEGTVRRRI